ncbi:MAG TPA: CBS domain-containing protein [Casimicrobiaceae bacterium]|nr:CBS domain-containing protein [Casimicrobiaceae bacterium]
MYIGQLCNLNVVCATPDTTIADAAEQMRKSHVGTLVVVDETSKGRRPVGIVTDRDIVIEVVAARLDADTVKLSDLLVQKLVTIEDKDDYADAIRLMIMKNIRRLPVVDASGILVGIITLDDMLRYLALPLAELSDMSARGRKRESEKHP